LCIFRKLMYNVLYVYTWLQWSRLIISRTTPQQISAWALFHFYAPPSLWFCEVNRKNHYFGSVKITEWINKYVACVVSRIKSLLEATSGTVAVGGVTDEKTNYISPTLLVDVQLSDSIMKDEVSSGLCPLISARYAAIQLGHALSLAYLFIFLFVHLLRHLIWNNKAYSKQNWCEHFSGKSISCASF